MVYSIERINNEDDKSTYVFRGGSNTHVFCQTEGNVFLSDKASLSFNRAVLDTLSDDASIKQPIGSFSIRGTEGNIFFQGNRDSDFSKDVYSWGFEYENNYTAFEVLLGRKGIHLCVYSGNDLIAQIVKDTKCDINRSKYDIYAKAGDVLIWAIISVFWDICSFPVGNEFNFAKMNTWQREMREKYSPTFIKEVKDSYYV